MTTETEPEESYNPLQIQLEGAAAMGDSCSRLVLQSLVAQSANVLKRMMDENKKLKAALDDYESRNEDMAYEMRTRE